MISIEMMPAAHGDALLVEYGPGTEPEHRILIDAGPPRTYSAIRERLLEIPLVDGARHLELLIVTHVDDDHIGGVVKLLQDDDLQLRIDDVWFNDWQHIGSLVRGRPPTLGAEQGEFLGALLEEQELPWNAAFGGAAVMVPPIPTDDEGNEGATPPLQSFTTPGGITLTVVSPTFETLLALKRKWHSAIRAAHFEPGNRAAALRQFGDRAWAKRPPSLGDERDPDSVDHAEANGSTIAVVAEFDGTTILLAGDAHPGPLREGLCRWAADETGIALDAFKVPHHGSEKNMTPQLMEAIDCPTYLVSTNGAQFGHPDDEAIEIIIANQPDDRLPEVLFNYRQPHTEAWADDSRVTARYGDQARLLLP